MSDNLPYNHRAEAALLASVMEDQSAMYQALQFVQPDDFHHRGHRIAYSAAIALFTRQQAIDPISLTQEVRSQGNDPRETVYNFLLTIREQEHDPDNAADYARIIADASIRRRIIDLSQHLESIAADGQHQADQCIQTAMQELLKLGQRDSQHGTLIPLAQLYDDYVADRLNANPDDPNPDIQTGYNALDDLITSLKPANLVILGARPSLGKSSLALNIGVNAAYQSRTIAFFSLEMSAQEVALRILSAESGIPAHTLQQGQFPEEDITQIIQYTQELSTLNFYVDESPILSVADISAKAQAVRIQAGLDLIIIDYLQLLASTTDRNARGQQRVQEISAISRDLKQMARELNVPVIAISQLNRAVEARPGSRPQLSDLRESGSIEQDADIVMFLYRQDRYYTEEEWAQMHPGIDYPENIAEIILAKHRNGPTGSIELFFQQPIMRFDNLPRDMPAEYLQPTLPYDQPPPDDPQPPPNQPSLDDLPNEPPDDDHLAASINNPSDQHIEPFPD